MNKKVIIGIIIVVAIIIVGYIFYSKNNEKTRTKTNNITEKRVNEEKKEDIKLKDGKILVVYYSATGSTKKVAEEISKNLDANIFEIEPVDTYTSKDLDWTDDNSRVSKEHEDESLRDVKLKNTKVNNWENYDTILIGYPIWWGIAAWPVNTFVRSNDFNGKVVIPFCTSASSSLGQSGKLLESEANGGNWLEGHRFSSGASISEIKTWTDSLK